jgi:uncharacterized Zn finger protein
VRNGSVVDLQIAPGWITAMVSGSELYKVEVKVAAVRRRTGNPSAQTALAASIRWWNCCKGVSPRA